MEVIKNKKLVRTINLMTEYPIDPSEVALHERDVWQSIQAFNRDRIEKILPLKYAKLRKSAFAFFRGTCHLFYQDLPQQLITTSAPTVWICGDLHLENFGTYKGDDRQIYFGVNDFDEGVLAPCTWDVLRLLTSIFLAADILNIDLSDAKILARTYLSHYVNTLRLGNAETIVETNADGLVKSLIKKLYQRKRRDFLKERTDLIGERRQLKFDDPDKLLNIPADRAKLVIQAIDNWAATQPNPDFFEVLDVGFRLAGVGSLGLDRYLILVAGKGSQDRNYLLDFKQQPSSALRPYVTARSTWMNQAMRVMRIQELVQSAPPALMAAIEFDNNSYLLRELQPTQDKVTLKADKIDLAQLEQLIVTIARVTASAHLHGSGKLGAASTKNLMAYGYELTWQQDLLNYACNYARQVQLDYRSFCQATED
jgi:uncharacterized protein (DUF2252 family)